MRLLNPNIINFGYPVYNPTTGMADATVLFFEQKPDLTNVVEDLIGKATAISNASFKAVPQGYVYHAESSVGIKAIEGSEYWPEYGITIHHPNTTTQRFIGSTDDTSTKNYAIPSFPLYKGTGLILSHPVPAPLAPVNVAMHLSYSQSITIDCVFRQQRNTTGELKADLWDFSAGAQKQATFILPDGQMTEAVTSFSGQDFLMHNAIGNSGRLCFAQQGDHTTTPITKTLAYAVIVFTRYGTGNTPTDNVVFGTEVGKTGSGAYLELFETTLSTGQYPIITNLRTGIL